MNFGMITSNQSTEIKQNYATWILTALLFILKPKIFMKTLLMMLKNGLCSKDDNRLLPIGWNKKAIGPFKDKLGGKIVKEFVRLGVKIWVYLMDDDTEHKKAKGTKRSVIERGLMVENYKDCLFNDKTIIK